MEVKRKVKKLRLGRIPKPKYNPGSLWCAHEQIKGITHETTRRCRHYTQREEKSHLTKTCNHCVYSGRLRHLAGQEVGS